ncbi:hypothetical protein [Chitinophaga agrisoli]|nr:hypothetical protein [Chitinophaga agrisoli]
MVYNIFRDKEDWEDVQLQDVPTLCCTAVTRQFLSKSVITKPKVKPAVHTDLPKRWIQENPESFKVKVWEGTPDEKEFITLGKGGGSLIEKDITKQGFHQPAIVIPKISFSDDETIDHHELTNIRIYAEFNERLYLCYKFGRNVDPLKDLIFGRPLPPEYKQYIDIISS